MAMCSDINVDIVAAHCRVACGCDEHETISMGHIIWGPQGCGVQCKGSYVFVFEGRLEAITSDDAIWIEREY